MTSTQMPRLTELTSSMQLNGKLSMLDSVSQVFQLPLVTDVTLESPLPSIQSWYPPLVTSDGVRYISHSDPLMYSGTVAPSVFLSSAADRNCECVLDMEGEAVREEHIVTQYIDTTTNEIKSETEEDLVDDSMNEGKVDDDVKDSSDINSAIESASTENGGIINFGSEFTIAKVVSKPKQETSKRRKRMVTTVATQTLPERTIYDDLDPVKLPVRYLYEFLELLLSDEQYNKLIVWKDKEERVFMLIDHHKVAELWGMHKRKKPMTYDKFSRALRFYYSKKILKKEPGRFTYRFLIQEAEFFHNMK